MAEICSSGRITFAGYMDLALYHPEEGYYMKGREKIGAAGDFYTSPEVSPLFGWALADQAEEMWRIAGCPRTWTILEMGAGKGSLAGDILRRCAGKHPGLFSVMAYNIMEKSPSMVSRQKAALGGCPAPGGGLGWVGSLEEMPSGSVCGCLFSNELVDAFPVHRVVKSGGRLKEIYVTCEKGVFIEEAGELSSAEIEDYARDIADGLEEGQEVEINLAMREWLKQAARVIDRGFLLTIDYGDVAARLHSPFRPGGTIRSYRRHRLEESLYQSPGCQDITASVNFTDLFRWGEEVGLLKAGYTSQMYFLLNLGILEYLKPRAAGGGCDPDYIKETMAVKKLIMPEGMGAVFKVAAQYRGLDEKPFLTGFHGQYGSRD